MPDPEQSVYMWGARPEIDELIPNLFAFLVEDKAFTARRPLKDTFTSSFTYVAIPKGLAIQIHPDFRDEAIDVYLVKLLGRRLPTWKDQYESPQRLQVILRDVLRDVMQVQDEELAQLVEYVRRETHRGYRYAEHVLHAWRNIIERHIDEITEQPSNLLFPTA
jgi:hypothetical protein